MQPVKEKIKAYIFVSIQFLVLAILLFYQYKSGWRHADLLKIIGEAIETISILGILFAAPTIRSSLTVMPIPKFGAQLGTGGLYKYVRHPMYSMVILFALGAVLTNITYIKILLLALLIIDLYYKSIFEDKLLSNKFKDYTKYAKNTPRFIPFIKKKVLSESHES